MADFYVYIHTRNDTGEVFYVGKGIGDRFKLKTSRNPHWHNIVKKHGYKIQILEHFDTEIDAHCMERYLIASYRSLEVKLCNLTDGGEGTVGFIHSDESKSQMSINGKITRADPELRKRLSEVHKTKWKNTDFREKMRASFRIVWSSTERRENISNKSKERWKNPEYRERLLRALKEAPITAVRIEGWKKTGLANRGRIKSPDEIKKISDAHKGRPKPKWIIDKMAVANKTRTRNAEEIETRRVAMLGNTNGNYLAGIPKSPETKEKMRLAWIKRKEKLTHTDSPELPAS